LELSEVIGHLAILRRFPVEPLPGETPSEALLAGYELSGDRVGVLIDAETGGRLSPESDPYLLRCGARFFDQSAGAGLASRVLVRVEGGGEYALSDPAWLDEVSRQLGRPVRLAARSEVGGAPMEVQMLSKATLGFVERAYGRPLEVARLRANLLVDVHGGMPFEEEGWIGKRIRIGDAELDVLAPSLECVLIGLEAEPGGDTSMLQGVLQVRGGSLGVQVRPVSGNRVRVGDPLSRVD
jgi:uncharacterized protein YcbX